MKAVNKKMSWGMSVAASAVALAMYSVTASAQLAPTQPPAAPAAPKAAAPAPAAPAAAKAAVPAPAAPKAATPAAKPAVVSACKGLDQAGCAGKAVECAWIVPKKVDVKTGKADNPYCRKVAGVAKKAADAKAAAAKAPAAAAATVAPKAATPVAPAAPAAPVVKK